MREPKPSRRRRALSPLLFLLATAIAGVPTTARADASTATPILGDYDAAIHTGDGHIDVSRTIARLQQAHVNTYAYLICGSTSAGQWRDLPGFLAAAQAPDIQVWAYLCPPSEAVDRNHVDFAPFGWDYAKWAAQLAVLSLRYPSLTAFAIDDFSDNLPATSHAAVTFSPAYTAVMLGAAHDVNPRLQFWPVLYYQDLVGAQAVLPEYRSLIDGVIFPFRDDPAGDTDTSDTAPSQILHVREALGAGTGLVVLVYAEHLSSQPAGVNPTPDYVDAVVDDALALADYGIDDGVMTYALDLTGDDTPEAFAASYDRIRSRYGAAISALPVALV